MQDNVRISVINEEIYPVNNLLFGQFLERPSWGGESGPEAALLPGTNKLDPRVESLLRTMDIPIVRFPGGSDVDYLDWRDMVTDAHGKGTGRPDTRKWEKQPITNAFGYDEYFRLATDLKWKSILVFNLHGGLLTNKTPAESAAHAAALLAYCVGTETSVPEEMRQWPALRAANGHPEPYKVEYVQIGNEAWFFAKDMKNKYGDAWVTPWAETIQLYIEALRRIKPDIKVITDGHPLEIAAELHQRKAGVDFFALHWYYPMGVSELFAADGKKLTESEVTAKQVWETMTHCIETNPEGLAEWKDASIDQAKRLGYKLAVTEWNLNAWGNFQRRDELWPGAGACGLGAAVMLNAILRGGSTFELATQSMLVGQAWGITGIRVYPKTGKAPNIVPTAEAVTLYNHYHGDRGLRVNYDAPPELWKPEVKFNATPSPCAKAAFVDVLATRNQEKLYVHAINTDFDKPRSVTLQLDGFGNLPAESTVHRLKFHTVTEFKSTNSWTSQETVQIPIDASSITIELPARSMTVAVFALIRADEPSAMTVIEPAATTNVLFNPGKGWSVFGSADSQPKEMLEYAGMGVQRFQWSELEPREGEFNFEPVDKFLEGWARLGKVCNIGVMCASTHGRDPDGYVTPKWVFDAGAKKIEMELSPMHKYTGTPGHKIAPVFDDPIFLAKLATFVRAFAARYDGDPRIAIYDIRSYGNWGECHMHPFGKADIAPEKFREHVQIHLDAFKKTQLCLSCNAHLGHYGPLKPVMDWAVLEKHIAPRRDGICGNSDGRETSIGLGIAPGVFELYGDYPFMKQLGWWDGKKDKNGLGFKLEECVENGKPTWVDLGRGGKSGMQMLEENRDLIDRLSNRIGYNFHLQRAAFPRRAPASGVQLELAWSNSGVAPIYIPCALAVALLNSEGKRIATAWPGEFQPKNWLPGKSVTEKSLVQFAGVAPGNYRLAIAITRKVGDTDPFIRLGTQLPIRDGWYELGTVEILTP